MKLADVSWVFGSGTRIFWHNSVINSSPCLSIRETRIKPCHFTWRVKNRVKPHAVGSAVSRSSTQQALVASAEGGLWGSPLHCIQFIKFLSYLSAKKMLQRCVPLFFVCVTLRAWMRVPAHWDCALTVHKRWILHHPKKTHFCYINMGTFFSGQTVQIFKYKTTSCGISQISNQWSQPLCNREKCSHIARCSKWMVTSLQWPVHH
jgi:hypothetical protein